MTEKEYKRKSSLLVYILRLEYWDNYARNLIKQLLTDINNRRIR